MMKLRSAAFRSSYQPLKELLNVFHANIIAIPLRLHPIEATFDQCESMLCRGGFFHRLLRRRAANKMMLLRDCISGSYNSNILLSTVYARE
jgi:hypothetical protein